MLPRDGDDGSVASLHVIQVSLLLPPDQIGGGEVPQQSRTAREPEPEAEAAQLLCRCWPAPIHKNQRHQQFVAWLVDTYGLDYLRSGSGVLDVAGGAGGIAFELAFRRGIPCVVVDPRPMKLNARQRRALKNRVNSQAVLAANPPSKNASWWLAGATAHTAATTTPPPASETASAPAQAQAVSMDLATECEPESMGGLMEVCSEVSQGGSAHEARTEEALTTPRVPASYADAWDEEGLPTSCLPRQVLGYFDSAFVTSPGTREVWEDCSIVVGMHRTRRRSRLCAPRGQRASRLRSSRAASSPKRSGAPAAQRPARRIPRGIYEYLEGLDDATGSGEPRAERQHQREGDRRMRLQVLELQPLAARTPMRTERPHWGLWGATSSSTRSQRWMSYLRVDLLDAWPDPSKRPACRVHHAASCERPQAPPRTVFSSLLFRSVTES